MNETQQDLEFSSKKRAIMLAFAKSTALEERTTLFDYPVIEFNPEAYYNDKPKYQRSSIKDISTDYLEKILKMSDHNIETNCDIYLHTVYEEVNKRKRYEKSINHRNDVITCKQIVKSNSEVS